MDKLIYLAAQAAKSTMARQDNIANNLANVSTPGFRAQLMAFRSAPVEGQGEGARNYDVESSVGFDDTPGQLQSTGRTLDLAVQGKGWFAVTAGDGSEAYTRAGSFQLDDAGQLVTNGGLPVQGTGGPISVPPGYSISVADDGTMTGTPTTGKATPIQLGKLKLVNPAKDTMERSDDGLFRVKGGGAADVDPNVKIASGYIETSNVNPVEMLVEMISAARSFETQMKTISSQQQNGQAANNLFSLN